MTIRTLGIATIAALIGTTAASAAPWESIDQRQAQLDRQIDAGVRGGNLDRAEATRLRAEFRTIAVRERDYRQSGGGLSEDERRDLDQRFGVLTKRITEQQSDRQIRR